MKLTPQAETSERTGGERGQQGNVVYTRTAMGGTISDCK